MPVTVEFYGMARQRAGCARLTLEAANLNELLAALARQYPSLRPLRTADGHLAPEYLLSMDGTAFVRDLQLQLKPGAQILLLGADAGG